MGLFMAADPDLVWCMTPMPAPRAAAAQPSSKPLALFGWMAFDWASQPFYTLVTTFLFSTYFANAFIGDATAGQALWGYILAAAGVVVALTSPIIGAIADAQGRLKRWIAVFSIVFVAAQLLLWFAPPNAAAAEIWLIAFAMILATVAAEYATVFNNALLPAVAGQGNLGRVSGAGWAAGYFGGLVSLALVAGFVASDPETGRSLLGLEPLVANDPETRAADRLVGRE
jgi:UMF1 family MFS transporter